MRLILGLALGVLLGSTAASAQQAVRYSTYLGGIGSDGAAVVATGPDGSTYVAVGLTSSSASASADVRVLKLAPVSRAVVYSFFIGGSANDTATSIGVASDGAVWVAGLTSSADFPRFNLTPPEFTGAGGFLFRLSPAGALTFSTVVSAAAATDNPGDLRLAVDVDGSAVLVGMSCGAFSTTPGVFQPSHAGACDGFMARVSAAGSLRAATYLGGSGFDQATSVALGPGGDIYVGGYTESLDLPASPGAFQATPGHRSCRHGRFLDICTDGFVGRFSPDLVSRRYLTYLRETDPANTSNSGVYERVKAIAVGAGGNVYATGATQSGASFPITPGAYQTTCRFCSGNTVTAGSDSGDIFVTQINASGTGLVYSTFLSGTTVAVTDGQTATAIAVDALGRAHITGIASTSDFPVVNGSSVGTGILARFNAQGSVLEYSTHLGGSGSSFTQDLSIAVDGLVWVGGLTNSTDIATTSDAWQPSYGGGTHDGFLLALSLPDARLSIDIPAGGRITAPFEVGGWAVDLGASGDSGIDAVHVYAYPNPGSGAAPIFLGAAPLGFSRPDIAALYGSQFGQSGWLMDVDSLPVGQYLLVAYGHSSVTNTFSVNATRAIELDSRPLLSIDSPAPGAVVPVGTRVFVGGWAIDQGASAGTGIDAIHVWIYPNGGNGTPFFAGVANYGVSRPDVGAAFGSRFTPSGYELDVNGLVPGNYVIAVFGHSTVTNSFVIMQTRAVTIQ